MFSLGFGYKSSDLLIDCFKAQSSENQNFYFDNKSPKGLLFETIHEKLPSILVDAVKLECMPDLPVTLKKSCSIDKIFLLNKDCTGISSFFDGFNFWIDEYAKQGDEIFHRYFERFDSISKFNFVFSNTFESGFGLSCLDDYVKTEFPKSLVYSFVSDVSSLNVEKSLILSCSVINSDICYMGNENDWKTNIFPSLIENPPLLFNDDKILEITANSSVTPVSITFLNQIKTNLLNSHLTKSKLLKDEDKTLIEKSIEWLDNRT